MGPAEEDRERTLNASQLCSRLVRAEGVRLSGAGSSHALSDVPAYDRRETKLVRLAGSNHLFSTGSVIEIVAMIHRAAHSMLID